MKIGAIAVNNLTIQLDAVVDDFSAFLNGYQIWSIARIARPIDFEAVVLKFRIKLQKQDKFWRFAKKYLNFTQNWRGHVRFGLSATKGYLRI